jgi:protein SCO1/2
VSATSTVDPRAARASGATLRSVPLPLLLLGVALGLTIALFAFARKKQSDATKLPNIAHVPAFDARDQRGRAFRAEEMRGSIWIVDFVFTSCPTVCPRLTARMAELQGRIEKLGEQRTPVKLLSLSVDPETDTPPVLATYAAKYGAHDATWTFATGKTEDLDRVVVQGFKQRYDKADPAIGIMEVMHGDRFVLVDARGDIRAYYDTSEQGALDRIVADVERVADER